MKKALVFGAAGQAGWYMSRHLVQSGYKVFAAVKHHCSLSRVYEHPCVHGVVCDVTHGYEIRDALLHCKPDEIYNFASMLYAPASWDNPTGYFEVNASAVLSILSKIQSDLPGAKFFNAGSAEVFGRPPGSRFKRPSTIDDVRRPGNPYAVAKCAAEETVRIYRTKGLFACTGVFFNMESPRRAKTFFAQRAAAEAVRIRKALDLGVRPNPAIFGKLGATRDWGLTGDYVVAAHRMLQRQVPADFLVATGISATCMDFFTYCLDRAGAFPRASLSECLKHDGVDNSYDYMTADVLHTTNSLGWRASHSWRCVARILVEAELGAGNPSR